MTKDLNSRIWLSDGMDYHFPEQSLDEVMDKPNTGVCFSGGGTRAMTATMGQLRALDHLGLIPDIRYISCVSGGSWATTIYIYYRGSEDILGPVTRPQDIDKEHLAHGLTSSQLAYGAAKSLLKAALSWQLDIIDVDYTSHDTWNYSVGEVYLEDFGLFDTDKAASHPEEVSYFSYDQTTVDEIKRCNPSLNDKTFLLVDPGKPYPIINSCMILPEGDDDDDEEHYDLLNFEYTPLTVGRPYATTIDGKTYGGSFIEPFAYRGAASDPTANPHSCPASVRSLDSAGYINISMPDRPFSLTETTGASSADYAQATFEVFGRDFGVLELAPQDLYWAVNEEVHFGDGGFLDVSGIIPLLQRGVDHIIAFINTSTKLDITYEPSDAANNDPGARCDETILALFGYNNTAWGTSRPYSHVFAKSEFAGVLAQFKEKKKNKQPMIVAAEHTVVQNDYWGVKGGRQVSVTWYYLDECGAWEEQLPKDTQKQIKNSGDFDLFPNYKTIGQNSRFLHPTIVELTNEQVTLLADFTCGCMLMDKDTIINAIRPSSS
ncbi:MAG: hypothetical protein AAF639_09545 [Chloroflexota bacterium]